MREDLLQHDEKERDKQTTLTKAQLKSPIGSVAELTRKSPSHSISSTTSSGSCPVLGAAIKSPAKESLPQTVASSVTSQMKVSSVECIPPGVKPKPDSISEDERSEVRYSSSGYYESPHEEDDEEQGTRSKARRLRQEDERKRRKTSMKLDIEKENMRALTSPIKKPTGSSKITSPEQSISGTMDNGSSPSKMKRFRPKIRRQLRKSSREDVLAAAAVRRNRATPTIFGLSSGSGDTELLLDASMSTGATTTAVTSVSAPTSASKLPTSESSVTTQPEAVAAPLPAKKPHSCATPTSLLSPKLPTTSGTQTKSTSDTFQLKAKSIESLRSVSPGSDSVFYSEADGNAASGEQSHCHHCGKEMEGKQQSNTISELAGDSVESIPYIEQDIVKPPSDFADSPVTTKTTQRLYKKMDKRFRSEERYHGERGRHYKTRQENIRAKVGLCTLRKICLRMLKKKLLENHCKQSRIENLMNIFFFAERGAWAHTQSSQYPRPSSCWLQSLCTARYGTESAH